MNLATQILATLIEKHGGVKITLDIPQEKLLALFSDTCYQALSEIHSLVTNENLTDFMCVEGVVQVLEKADIDCGSRHDF